MRKSKFTGGAGSQARHQHGDLLQLEIEVRRRSCVGVEANAGVGSREREAQADVRRAGDGKRGNQGCAEPKTVEPSAKRQVAEVLVRDHQLPIRRACQIVKLSRAAYYRQPKCQAQRDAEVIEALNEVVAKRSRWGFWKCFDRLRLDGRRWNHKRVHRVYCAMRLNLPRRTKKRLPSRIVCPLVAPSTHNRIWAMDFMHDALYGGRKFRTFNVIDESNREALGIEVGTSIPSARVVRVLERMIDLYGPPQAIRMDNGPEFCGGT